MPKPPKDCPRVTFQLVTLMIEQVEARHTGPIFSVVQLTLYTQNKLYMFCHFLRTRRISNSSLLALKLKLKKHTFFVFSHMQHGF